jgi:hypothetical protein
VGNPFGFPVVGLLLKTILRRPPLWDDPYGTTIGGTLLWTHFGGPLGASPLELYPLENLLSGPPLGPQSGTPWLTSLG